MALGVPGFVRIGAVIAGCALVAACTPEPGPATTPTPVPSIASPTPSATPTETEIERQQRLDFEAAEQAYRDAVAETERLARAGGVAKASPELVAVATGDYLETALFTLRTIREHRWRLDGSISIRGVKPSGGWSADRLSLVACEDNSTWKMLDSRGRNVTAVDRSDYIQTLTVTKTSDAWRVSDVETKKVASLSERNCGA